MATDEVTTAAESALIADPERGRVALWAAYELEAVGGVMVKRASELDAEDLDLRALAIRTKVLSEILMSALGDEMVSNAALRRWLEEGVHPS
jgi:hypothetical protein